MEAKEISYKDYLLQVDNKNLIRCPHCKSGIYVLNQFKDFIRVECGVCRIPILRIFFKEG